MTTDPFTEAARAEAEAVMSEARERVGITVQEQARYIEGRVAGASWARDHLAAQEPTDAAIPENFANLIRDLIDPDDCWFDHHGGCQAHGYLDLTPEQECPHSEAKRLLAARAARRDEEKR